MLLNPKWAQFLSRIQVEDFGFRPQGVEFNESGGNICLLLPVPLNPKLYPLNPPRIWVANEHPNHSSNTFLVMEKKWKLLHDVGFRVWGLGFTASGLGCRT